MNKLKLTIHVTSNLGLCFFFTVIFPFMRKQFFSPKSLNDILNVDIFLGRYRSR